MMTLSFFFLLVALCHNISALDEGASPLRPRISAAIRDDTFPGKEGARSSSITGFVANSSWIGSEKARHGKDRIAKQNGKSSPAVDVIVSFRSVHGSRDFWVSFLEFWPPDLGDLYIVVDYAFGNSTEWFEFKHCLTASPGYTPKFAVLEPEIRHTKKRDDLFWKVAAFTKNHWKFHLDSVVPSGGQDRILAIIDDDSCLLDHFVLDDIVDPATGKIIARGIMQKDQSWARWVRDIGLPWIGNFMTDFPVFWWRDMLPDMRKWMVKHTTGEKMSENPVEAKDQFWRAYQKLFRETPGGHSCEYCILLNFAHSSDKWRDRYEWRIAPDKISMGMSLHQHRCGCPRKAEIPNSLREVLLFYPYGLRTTYGRMTRPGGKAPRVPFTPSDWWWREFLTPPFREYWKQGPVASNQTVRNLASDLHTKEQFSKYPIASERFNHSLWAEHVKGGDRKPWSEMLQKHDTGIEKWRQEGRALSHLEVDPRIMDSWKSCFSIPSSICKH